MKDNSNETLRFVRNSGLKRSDFEEFSNENTTPSQGDVVVFVIVAIVLLLLVAGVV